MQEQGRGKEKIIYFGLYKFGIANSTSQWSLSISSGFILIIRRLPRLPVASGKLQRPVYANRLDHFTLALAHSSVAFTLEIADANVKSWENLGLLVFGGSEYVGVGPDMPLVTELRLEYTNAK